MIHDASISDTRIALYELRPHKNHGRRHYHPRYVTSFQIKSMWLKKLIGRIWYWMGGL